jgi:putative membrane protein
MEVGEPGSNNGSMNHADSIQAASPRLLLVCMTCAIVFSSCGPSDRFTWFLETVPLMIGMPILWLTAKRFPLTPLLRFLIGVHACILALGGAYTYAEVPLGFWLQDVFGFDRNPYDRIGHLAQGFIPAVLTREILLRSTPLQRGAWLNFLSVSVCLAFSAFYELIEWWAALASGESATAFLGTQGDIWDTQWDMFLALIGACVAIACLASMHNRQLAKLGVAMGR